MMALDDMIAVIQSFKEGKQLQLRDSRSESDWKDIAPVVFSPNFYAFDYRVKPEPRKPREWWLQVDTDTGKLLNCDTQPATNDGLAATHIIHVREVLPESPC